MLKVMTIVGTRPEIIKLSRVIAELDKYTNHVLVHTGQNYDYELNDIFFEQMRIRKPDYYLNAASDTPIKTIANVLVKTDEVLEQEKPDAVLLYGDTNSCISVVCAKRRKIPIFHMEAGNRCFDQTVPEEINRKIVDHLSDINMPLTEHARKYLEFEGIKSQTIIKTGSAMLEVLNYYKDDIDNSDVLQKLNVEKGEYFVISAHREENIDSDSSFDNLIMTLNAIAEKYDKRIIVSTHPRTKNKIRSYNKILINEKIEFLKPLGFFDYIKLQMNSFCVISDSGTITEEASVLSLPAVTIRNAHERPEGMDEGTLIMSGLNAEMVLQSIDIITKQHFCKNSKIKIVQDYNTDNVSTKVVRTIMSYTDYVSRTVWKK